MGAVTKVVGSIFGLNESNSPTVTAKDVLPSSESTDPQSAVMGSDTNFAKTMDGKSSLLIDLDSAANTKKQQYNGLYNSQK